MAPVIHVTRLSKRFKEVNAVDDLSFTVNAGDVYGFLGQNGAGKSTTIRMLLTLITPTAGEIEIFGLKLKRNRREILQQVGAVIERPDLYKYLTGLENLRLFAKMSGVKVSEKKLMDQMEMVGLAGRAHSKVKTYSQGMKQRLGIGVALAHDPKLIILDEPTNGLDPHGIADIRNLILHLSRDLNKTVVVSSHLLSEIELIANRMLIIDKGRKMVEGAVNELFDPSKSLVELETTNIAESLQQLKGSSWQGRIKEQRSSKIILQAQPSEVPVLMADLVQLGVQVLSIQPRHSLEDYFLSLTSGNQHVADFTN
jgi:ABC-type multidrug transport system ATPase subunit